MSNKSRLHRQIWNKKKILREIYHDWYKKILADLKPSSNQTVEIGAGSGNFKMFHPNIIACDIETNPWINRSFDAHQMPFKDRSLGNIVLIDTLHHLTDPVKFLREAGRVLEKGGKIIMLEPYPSPFSLFIYRIFHPEPFIMNVNYFQGGFPQPNQAIPFLLFFKHYKETKDKFEGIFSLTKRKKISFILYPLSGGFENRSLIPNIIIPLIKLLEYLLIPFKDILAFRCYIVLEKK